MDYQSRTQYSLPDKPSGRCHPLHTPRVPDNWFVDWIIQAAASLFSVRGNSSHIFQTNWAFCTELTGFWHWKLIHKQSFFMFGLLKNKPCAVKNSQNITKSLFRWGIPYWFVDFLNSYNMRFTVGMGAKIKLSDSVKNFKKYVFIGVFLTKSLFINSKSSLKTINIYISFILDNTNIY